MKRLYRSRIHRKIAGVCGGIAEYFAVDPIVVRLIVIVVFIFTGFVPMTLAYLIAWAMIPEYSGNITHS